MTTLLLERCARPGRAVRLDAPRLPRLRPLVEVLAERRAALAAADPGTPPPPGATGPDLDALARGMRPLAARVLGAVAEVAGGRRPAAHLATVCSPELLAVLTPRLATLAADPALPGRPTTRPNGFRISGLRVSAVTAAVLEVAAALHGPRRTRAIAARLVRTDATPVATDPAARGAPATGSGWRVASLAVL